jgi:hypothetical protein
MRVHANLEEADGPMSGGRERVLYIEPAVLVEEMSVLQHEADPLEQFGVILDDRYPDRVV